MKQRIIRADRIIMPAANVCDECLTAVYDEAPIAGMTADDMALCAIEMGADIGDHRCEHYDDPDIECLCACRRPRW